MNSEYNTCVPGIANGSNALSYMSFVAAIITLGKLISINQTLPEAPLAFVTNFLLG